MPDTRKNISASMSHWKRVRPTLSASLEADRSHSYVINLNSNGKNVSPLSFLEMTSQGLVVLSDDNIGDENFWRFPSSATGDSDMLASKATGNLTSAETVLYRTERNDNGGFERIAFKQSQVVEALRRRPRRPPP